MAKRAVFLDRDNTLIEDPEGYLTDPAKVQLRGSAAEALRKLRSLGFLTVVATNQSAVARGMTDTKTIDAIHERIQQLLAEQGAGIDRFYYCPYHPEGSVKEFAKDSPLRKPKPGMLLQAARELDIDLSQSWMIGDAYRDIAAGHAAGCRTILLPGREGFANPQADDPRPDFMAEDLMQAVEIIERDSPGPAAQTAEPAYTAAAKAEKLADSTTPADSTSRLLNDMLTELRRIRRAQNHREFSFSKLLAGVVQMMVIFCLVMAYFAREESGSETVMTWLLMATVLQTMTLTLMVTHWQR